VAAQLCGDRGISKRTGYKVEEDGTILAPRNKREVRSIKKVSKLGARKAILNDLSPAATFIAYNYQ
jgi:hypothetical protein